MFWSGKRRDGKQHVYTASVVWPLIFLGMLLTILVRGCLQLW